MKSTNVIISSCVAIAMLSSPAMGEGDEKSTTLTAGTTLTDGNTETMQANASLVAKQAREGEGSLRYGVEGNYGENTVDSVSKTTAQNAKAFGNVKKTLSETTFCYTDASVLYDDIALIDYRATVGPGLGKYLVKSDTQKCFVEAGIAYVWQDVANVKDDFVALRVAERLELALSETANVWQSAEYVPEAEDLANYLVNLGLGIEAAMNASMNLRLVLQDRYDSEPGIGLKENDLSLIAGVSIKL